LDTGLTLLRLETGTQQIAAIRSYQRNGFQPCSAFEPYSSMQPHSVATSLFLEKQLFVPQKDGLRIDHTKPGSPA
jgi:hypothetical protein